MLKEVFVSKKEYNPLISVIVASYNYEKYIAQTLDTLISQTYQNYEIIVVDDGSKDNSVAIIKQYEKKYKKISLYQHPKCENKGLAETVKLGLAQSKGDYIAFCEADDFWTKDHLEKKVSFLKKNPNAKIICNNVFVVGDYQTAIKMHNHFSAYRQFKKGKNKISYRSLSTLCIPGFSCTMIKKDILLKLDFLPFNASELDTWLFRQILIRCPLYYIDEKLSYRRLSRFSYSRQQIEHNHNNRETFIKKSVELLKTQSFLNTIKIYYANRDLIMFRMLRFFALKCFRLKKILLVSNSLTNTGAPIVLLSIAEQLSLLGYKIDVHSLQNGPLEEEFIKIGCHCFCVKKEDVVKHNLPKHLWQYKFAIANTCVCCTEYMKLVKYVPTAWIIHEGLSFFENKKFPAGVLNTKNIWTVSEPNQKNLKKFIPDIKFFQCGIKDYFTTNETPKQPVFAVVGRIDKIKGMDIFIDAVNTLPIELRRQAKFLILGQKCGFYKQLRKMDCRFISFIDDIKPEQMPTFYRQISCLVVPSREEVLPTVVLEAMMMGKPVIISEVVGAKYLVSDKNGFKFEALHSSELAAVMEKIIKNPDVLSEKGKHARQTYLCQCTLTVLERSVIELLRDIEEPDYKFM